MRPRLYLLPKIIKPLGYDPLQSNASTLGEKNQTVQNSGRAEVEEIGEGIGC
jgi:hypothetical protein